jgi:CRP-like cAMP-binding protein
MATNLILSGLPSSEQTHLQPYLQRITLKDGERLVEPGGPITSIWFSEGALLYSSQPLPSGHSIPAGLSGSDGVAGFELWLGKNISPLRTVAEVGGSALRMNVDDLNREVLGGRSQLNGALGDFVLHFLTMGAQLATCLQTHLAEERLCRWLQMIVARIPEREQFPMSQAFVASLLHSERNTALLAMRVLEHAGLIEYNDQQVRVLDKEGLLDGCCECLDIFQQRLFRLQGRDFDA